MIDKNLLRRALKRLNSRGLLLAAALEYYPAKDGVSLLMLLDEMIEAEVHAIRTEERQTVSA